MMSCTVGAVCRRTISCPSMGIRIVLAMIGYWIVSTACSAACSEQRGCAASEPGPQDGKITLSEHAPKPHLQVVAPHLGGRGRFDGVPMKFGVGQPVKRVED